MTALLLLGLLALPATNHLPGDTSFDLGLGDCRLVDGPELAPPRLVDGAVELTAPGGVAAIGSALVAPCSLPLRPGETYTLAFRAHGEGAPLLEVAIRDSFGRGPTARVAVGEAWREAQVTFVAEPLPADEAAARAAGLDWARRLVVPGESEATPRVSVRCTTVRTQGLPGRLWLDDLRLVPGAAARPAAPPPLAIDCGWSERGAEAAARPGAVVVAVAARGSDRLRARLTVRDPVGQVLRNLPLAGASPWAVPLPDLPSGLYEVVAEAADGALTATRRRWLPVLGDRALEPLDDSPWLLAEAALPRAAEARSLGYRRVRVVLPWAAAADRDGRARLDEVATRLAPALAMRFEITLALSLTPAGRLPAGVVTGRRMDSHGYAKGVPLPDVGRFEAWVTALATHLRGEPIVWELDDAPFRSWHGNDYTEYLRRFRAALLAVDPAARVAGLGGGFEAPGQPKLAGFWDEVFKREAPSHVDRLTAELPGRHGDAPESALGVGLAPLLDLLAERTAAAPEPWVVLPARTGRPVGPADREALRLAAASRDDELSDLQLASRCLREWLLAQRVGPLGWAPGWTGGVTPREVALDVWLTRYRGAWHHADLDLGAGLAGVVLALPDGQGLAAVWDAADDRWSLIDERLDDPVARLRVAGLAGVTVRARSLFGRELRETYDATGLTVPLSFAPVYLEGPSPRWLLDRLLPARVEGHRAVRLVPYLAVRDGWPGVAVAVANDSLTAAAGEVRVRGEGGLDLVGDRIRYEVAGHRETIPFVPVANWSPAAPARVSMVGEAGWRLAVATRSLLQWPATRAGLPRVDGLADDWPDDAPTYRLASADRLLDRAADWLGPDDAGLLWRGAMHRGTLALAGEVTDDLLQLGPGDSLTATDAVEVLLDLDLAGDALGEAVNGDDYRVVVAPGVEGQFVGRLRVVRGPGGGEALLDEKGADLRCRRTTTGWTWELLLPLTVAGREVVEANAGLGLDVLLHDDDGQGREVSLAMFGSGDGHLSTRGYAHVWLPWAALRPAASPRYEVGPGRVPAWVVRFEPLDFAQPYRLTPGGFRGAVVSQPRSAAFVRGDHLLRVDLRRPRTTEATVAELSGPADERLWGVWARVALAAERPADQPRLGLRREGVTQWLRWTTDWRRREVTVPAGTGPVELVCDGRGILEVAELDCAAAGRPAAPAPEVGGPRQTARRVEP